MRYQGKLINWKDEQGFGFVTPNGGGEKTFVHISAFFRQSPRPIENDLITYELFKDDQGRFCAKNIRFAHEVVPSNAFLKLRIIFTAVSLSALLCLIWVSQQSMWLAKIYLVLATITFVVYAVDKWAAKNDNRRTRENTLHVLAIIGGWPGALLAHQLLRHKSVKKQFRVMFWLTVAVNLFVLGLLITQ